MRVRLLLLIVALVAPLLSPASAAAQEEAPRGQEYRPGVVLVGFRAGASAAAVDALRTAGYDVTGQLPELNIVAVAAQPGQEASVAGQLAQLPGVAFAEPDYWASLQGASSLIPNDAHFAEQWALPLIGAPEAWTFTTGSSGVIIAVIDSGIDLQHPDLKDKLWVNTGEIPYNGKDDDGNGKPDDVNGWHFYQAWNGSDYESRENGLVQDDSGHGSHVAGIAAAATDNGKGIAGIAWKSPVMAVKVIDKTIGLAAYSDVASGILYAASNGAAVINLSLGGAAPSQTLCAAVSRAVGLGKIVVAAAGNKDDTVYYPAACPGATAVGATDQADNPAEFSNPGARVDLSAPGVDILSAWYSAGLGQRTYVSLSGTSEAAPHVAAAAALVWARWPFLTIDGVKAQLQGSVVDVGLPGRDDETGWGRLDLARALDALSQPVDLRLHAHAEPAVVIAGNALTATFAITNSGTTPATSVTLSANLPANPVFDNVFVMGNDCSITGRQMRCGMTDLAPGSTLTVTVVMTPTTVGDGVIATSASVNSAQRELSPSDNRETVLTKIRPVLWGRVFLDGNGDGVLQPWEARGAPNAWVLLEQGGQPVAYTGADVFTGLFQFDVLPSGSYELIAELPQEYQLTTPAPVALDVLSDREQSVFIGAWTGEPIPIPGRVYLPMLHNRR